MRTLLVIGVLLFLVACSEPNLARFVNMSSNETIPDNKTILQEVLYLNNNTYIRIRNITTTTIIIDCTDEGWNPYIRCDFKNNIKAVYDRPYFNGSYTLSINTTKVCSNLTSGKLRLQTACNYWKETWMDEHE